MVLETYHAFQEVNTKGAEGSLLVNSVISPHLIEELRKLNYPEKSIQSMQKCGQFTGFEGLSRCTCCNDQHIIAFKHYCSLRTCPTCAKIRKRKIFKAYRPILSQYSTNPRAREFIQFLTIAPDNYQDLKEGLEHIKKTLHKFFHNKYIQERILGGIYVIEDKNTGKGSHLHIHCIFFGCFLDNRIRGHCPKCSQNLIKKNYITGEFYCGNHKCGNTANLSIKEDSKLVSIWKRCSEGRQVHIHIQRQTTTVQSLNYMLKYVSINKEDFQNESQLAEYIVVTRKQKLITRFGCFFKVNITKIKSCCRYCGGYLEFYLDRAVVSYYKDSLEKLASAPPPNTIKLK